MNRIFALITAITLSGCTGEAEQTVRPHTLHIALDVSISAPVMAQDSTQRDQFAELAAAKAARIVSNMHLGDRVRVQAFGERSLGNMKTLDLQISHQARPPQAAQAIAALIRGIPDAEIAGQNWTQITRYLSVVGDFDCPAGDHILIITDGIESTPDFSERDFLAGRTPLPTPQAGILSGCKITMFGIGVSAGGMLDASRQDRLIAQWRNFAASAGAQFAADILQ